VSQTVNRLTPAFSLLARQPSSSAPPRRPYRQDQPGLLVPTGTLRSLSTRLASWPPLMPMGLSPPRSRRGCWAWERTHSLQLRRRHQLQRRRRRGTLKCHQQCHDPVQPVSTRQAGAPSDPDSVDQRQRREPFIAQHDRDGAGLCSVLTPTVLLPAVAPATQSATISPIAPANISTTEDTANPCRRHLPVLLTIDGDPSSIPCSSW